MRRETTLSGADSSASVSAAPCACGSTLTPSFPVSWTCAHIDAASTLGRQPFTTEIVGGSPFSPLEADWNSDFSSTTSAIQGLRLPCLPGLSGEYLQGKSGSAKSIVTR